ncbi:PREDICTED: heat shock protein DDB_G0288861 [Drosophila arizonae]|uniref:Heat shock protein DDB_G0288861 n=1 Tax=Drosophila arizonae TaxID=7263 RepID=A0ABM1P447_DROAR|nr:PREDICTED: heat shock protein DDB_G0288861 [Drosophila arizonae]
MSFFRNIRSSLASSRKSSSRDTTPVRSCSSRPASVISSRRGSTTSSTLQRGDTFILNGSDEEQQQQQQQQRGNESNSSTLEKKSKKSKVFSKFSTFTKRKKQPSPEEVASYEHHPSDTATNTYYKWRNDGDRMLDYDAHADPFNFLYEQQGKGRQSAGSPADGMQRQPSLGSSSSGSFDSSTYRKSKTPTHLREQLEQLKTHSNDDLLEEEERDKYKTVTLNSFRKSFRDRLLQQQQQQPHNPAWFVEVPPPEARPESSSQRSASKENRPDFLVFDNDNYRPQSRSPLRDRPSRSATRSPVKRNETFRVAQPMLRRMSPSPTPKPTPPASAIRIEIKNSILPHSPGRLVPVGVAKPMPTTEYYAQRLLASSQARQQQQRQQQSHSTSQQQQPQRGGRYQTLVHIGSEQGKLSPALARGRAPTRVQLYGSKPSSNRQQPTPTYFGGHYNAPAPVSARPLSSSRQSSGGVATSNWGRREQQQQQQPKQQLQPQPMPRVAHARQRNRSPIKIPWR